MFTKKFWKAAAERSVATAGQAVLAVIGVDQVVNAFELDWVTLGGVAAGGAFLSLVKSIAVGKFTDGSPSLGGERLSS